LAVPECVPDLSREGFVQEVVFPQATSRTPAFDDYTVGSYHIDKIGLLEAVRNRRISRTPEIVGLLILGPSGPLWQYDVLLFLSQAQVVSIHLLTMAHARITWKAAGSISQEAYSAFVTDLSRLPDVVPGVPVPASSAVSANDFEWSYGFLGAVWSPSELVLASRWDWYDGGSSSGALDRLVHDLTSDLHPTYSVALPEDESILQCPP
jgi:hypothetical protein